MKTFTTSYVAPVTRSNAEMTDDFLDLMFRMESGRPVGVMTRFEGPISVRVVGAAPATLSRDLASLIGRLRNEANIDIGLTTAATANVTIQAIPQAQLQRAVPRAACFVVPQASGWSDFLSKRHGAALDWAQLKSRTRISIFVPSDAAPQEIRDCLHEELAQGLAPLNDLYRLPDSVFNDDNIHAVLTGFDMLMLRVAYAPELHSGMTRAQASVMAPRILRRINPRGEFGKHQSRPDTARDWIKAMEVALTNGSTPGARRQAAANAVDQGRRLGWTGPRAGFALYAYGRLQVGNDSAAALAAFNAAEAAYRVDPRTQIHAAHIAVQKAAFSLSAGDAASTIALADAAIPIAEKHQNAALMSTLMMFKAAAFDMQGQTAAAAAVRLDSLGWARYGFGTDADVQARLTEVAGLRPF